jgi:hypothetical protein
VGIGIPIYLQEFLLLAVLVLYCYFYISKRKQIYILFIIIITLYIILIVYNTLLLNILLFVVFITGLIVTKNIWWTPLAILQFSVVISFFYPVGNIILNLGVSPRIVTLTVTLIIIFSIIKSFKE